MSNRTLEYILTLVDKGFKKTAEEAAQTVGGLDDKTNKLGAGDKMAAAAFKFNMVRDAVSGVNQAMESGLEPGRKFEVAYKEIEAITGVTGTALENLKNKARENAKEFGGSAADQMAIYTKIISRFGPEIASQPEALDKMARSAAMLGKTMQNDMNGGVDAATTAMLQFGADLSNPKQAAMQMAAMNDVMTASAKEGAAEVNNIAASLVNSGTMAKSANVSFVESNAAIQALAKGGKYGAEAGTAFRNVLAKMSEGSMMPKQSLEVLQAYGVNVDKLTDKTLPLTTRLKELAKIQNDSAAMTQVFGAENAAAGSVLLSNVGYIDQLIPKIQAAGQTQEMAGKVMESGEERWSRIKAKVDDYTISLYSGTSAWSPYLSLAGRGIETAAQLGPAWSAASTAVSFLTDKTKFAASVTRTWGYAQYILNAAMTANPIGVVVVAVAAVAAGVYVAYQKSERFRAVLAGIGGVAAEIWKPLSALGTIIAGIVTFNPAKVASGVKELATSVSNMDIKGSFNNAYDKSMAASAVERGKQILEEEKANLNKLKEAASTGDKKAVASYQAAYKKMNGKEDANFKPTTPAFDLNFNANAPGAGAASKLGGSTSIGNSVTGGNSVKNIRFDINKLIERFEVNYNGTTQSAQNLKDEITRIILDAVRDAEIALS